MPAVRRPLLLTVVSLAACNSSSRGEPGSDGDVPGCAAAEFANPQPLDGVVGNAEDPSATGNPLELWFARSGIVPSYDIAGARRASTSSAFDTPLDFEHNSTASDRDPQLTGDGLAMVFISDRDGGWHAYEARRASTSAAFDAPARIELPAGHVDSGIDLSADGLTLYMADGGGELRAATRSARTMAFTAAGDVLASAVQSPTLSPDELELYYTRTDAASTYRRTRASKTSAIDKDERLVVEDATEPDVVPDSERLYVKLAGFTLLTRSCE